MRRLAVGLPAPLRDPAQRWPLLGWLGVGLAVRLLVMPFTVSADLLAVYWRSHLIAHDGQLFSGYLVNMGAHYLHALALRLLDPLLAAPDVLWTDPWWWSDASALAPQVQRAFETQPDSYATLFALKLPYLLADLGAGLLLLALVAACRPALVRRAWAFWMLSPIGLYATYLFGRYEALAVVLVVAALLAVERDRPWLGALLLGVAITVRGYPLLLVPLFALVAVRGRRQAAWAGLALLPLGATMAANRLLAGSVGELARLRDFETGATFFAYTIPVADRGQIYVFFLFAFAAYGVLAGRSLGWWGSGPVPPSQLWVWLLVFHAGMFALATFSAHYFMWFTPFVALALARRQRWRGVLALHLAQVAAVLVIADALGGPGTLLGLFEPVSAHLVTALPNLREALLASPGLTDQVVGLARTGFVVATALLAWP
ncbi:MAG: hypothetical protein M3276_06880, partial [Actinomycetota bacterium]|nr:hypothetical protein [Actinomycetota bacterium]